MTPALDEHEAPDMRAYDALAIALPSPIVEASNEAWTRFVRLSLTASISSVSESNALGAFQFMPRRLADLGLFRDPLAHVRSRASGRTIWAASTKADRERAQRFLRSLSVQYLIFMMSMKDYALKLRTDEVKMPTDCTMSGALAIVHRAGLPGLQGKRFPSTQEAFERCNGVF